MAHLDALIEDRVRRAVKLLAEEAEVRAAYVFGSQITGQAHQYSDVDIGVFIEEPEKWDLRRRLKVSTMIHKQLGFDLEFHFFSARNLVNTDSASFAAYVLKHGVPISLHN
jgi:predicted nucleotidyltransferase